MKKGIAVAGNMIVDTIYPITQYPLIGQLTSIENPIIKATGGALCNVIINLAKLDCTLPLSAVGVVGDDTDGDYIRSQLSQYSNINLTGVTREGTTSFTSVMSDLQTKQRTFFHFRGANASFSEAHMPWDQLDVDILHVGYLLLLDALDLEDAEYGTKMARLLAHAQARGIKTSIDVVTDSAGKFKTVVPPALKYTDYCVINEIEAEGTTGIALRMDGVLWLEHIPAALEAIKALGARKWVIIHAPEGGYGLDCESGEITFTNSLILPDGYIQGTNGAGDAFCSGILYAAYQEQPIGAALELAVACAACSLSEPGATDGMKTYDEVLNLHVQFPRGRK